MAHASDEARTLRARQEELEAALGRGLDGPGNPGDAAVLTTVTVTTYPTTPQAYYGVQRLTVGGTEAEGAAPALTAGGAVFYALNLGSAVPPAGVMVVGAKVGARWVFRYDG